MKAVVKKKPGEGLEFMEMTDPEVPRDYVLLKVKYCGICGSDIGIYRWKELIVSMMEPHLPVIIGHEICGEIAAVGQEVVGFRKGERVVVEPSGPCGKCYYCKAGMINLCLNDIHIGVEQNGGMAEYASVPASTLYRIPDTVPDDEAALLETLATAVHALERVTVIPGDSVAVLGAGPIGLLLLQCVKAGGATPLIVTDVALAQGRLNVAKQLGADETIMIDRQELATIACDITQGRGFDVVFEASGSAKATLQAVAIARRGGKVCLVGSTDEIVELKPYSMMRSKEVDIISSERRIESSWRRSLGLVASGKVRLGPIIGHRLPLDRVFEGFRLLEQRQTLKVVLRPD